MRVNPLNFYKYLQPSRVTHTQTTRILISISRLVMIHLVEFSFYYNNLTENCSKSLSKSTYFSNSRPDKHTCLFRDRETKKNKTIPKKKTTQRKRNDEWLFGFELSHMSDSLPNILYLLKSFHFWRNINILFATLKCHINSPFLNKSNNNNNNNGNLLINLVFHFFFFHK